MSTSRRDFLKIAGLTAGATAAGVSPFGVTDAEAAPVQIWTGFHWCSPIETWRSDQARWLFQRSGRWGAVVILPPSSQGQAHGEFVHACNRVMDARQAVGGGRSLDQTIVRLWHPNFVSFGSVGEADVWLRGSGYYDSLNYFVTNGGRNAVIFNELNVSGEPQHNLDPRTLGYLAFALQNAYWNGGNRGLYTLFPGPSGRLGLNAGNWIYGFWDYFARYDFLTAARTPRTFGQVYGTGVDAAIRNRTMLHHGGSGVFDRLSQHCYGWDPNDQRNPNGTVMDYLKWTRDYIDASGWVYVTESSCDTGTDYNSQYSSGTALADFEYNASNQFRSAWPYFLQGIYGYILEPSDAGSVSNPSHKIGDPFMDGYNARRQQLGF